MKQPRTTEKSAVNLDKAQAKKSEAKILDAKVLPWKEEETVQTSEQDDVQKRAAERRQNRIINYFNADKVVTLSPEEIVGLAPQNLRALKRERAYALKRAALEVAEPRANIKQREIFFQSLMEGKITAEAEKSFLLLIPGALETVGAEAILAEIQADPRQMQILAVAMGRNASNWQKLDAAMIEKFLTAQAEGEDCRTPVDFAKSRQYFLRGIKPKASAELYRRYEQSMDDLERALYGERWEFYRQFEVLRNEAKRAIGAEKGTKVTTERRRKSFKIITPEKSSEMLGRAVIEGDPWRSGNLERHLVTHNLAEAKLMPTYEVAVDQEKIYLSEIFHLPNHYLGVIAYVPAGDQVRVRAYYLEHAEGLWRYLPDYTRRSDGGIERYCTGYSDESVILPADLQAGLSEILKQQKPQAVKDAEFYVAGTAYAYNTLQEYQALWSYGRMKGDYYTQVSRDPLNHDFGLNGSNQKKAPYTLAIDYNRAPDFGQKIVQFENVMPDVGMAKIEVFASHDGQYNWLMCRDARNRVWVDYVEAISPLTSTGLRRDWVSMGDWTTKLYEHTNQAGIYGDRTDTKGAKQGMWKNYLRNLGVIKEYLEAKAR